MGSFSWNKADNLTQIENVAYGTRFKFLIPKDKAQEVTILESWTLKWEIQGNGYNTVTQHKSFIDKDDANEFEKQLKSSAKFLGAWVETKITKN